MITYRFTHGQWVFCKNGTYFALNYEQMAELLEILKKLLQDRSDK